MSASSSHADALQGERRPSSSDDRPPRLLRSLTGDGTDRYPSLPRRLGRSIRHHYAGDRARTGGDGATRHRSSYDDPAFLNEVQAGAGNGVRVWYESYTTIDWIHDAIKESSRLRRIRNSKGYRGVLTNFWDRLQGWVVVTIVGVITALIAGGIVKSEALLFDLKEGYCARDWRLAKRFCCPYGGQPDWDGDSGASLLALNGTSSLAPVWPYRTRFMQGGPTDPTKGLLTGMGNRMLAGWAAPVALSPKWKSIDPKDESCPGWITWADKLQLRGEWNFVAEYGVYIAVALLWASIACLLTVKLTSSELYASKKDAAQSTASAAKSSSTSDTDENTPLLGSRQHGSNPYTGRAPQEESGVSALPSNLLAQAAGQQRARQALPPRKVLYFGSGSGISEIKCILSGFVVHGYLGFWTLFTKSVGLALSVASGLSLGKEGPFVHIASCVGNIVCRLFPKYDTNESKRREMLSCACAAGVAVAFGAPVGGVLFSMEEVSYYFPAKVMFRSFFCAMVAATTLRFLDPFGTGKIVLFQVTYDRDWHWVELAFFVLLGIFGGVYGALFTKLNMLWSKQVRSKTWMARHPLFEVMMITIVTVAVSFLNGYTRMGGPELIADLFSECHEHESLEGLCVSRPSQVLPLISAVARAMLAKGVLTVITFGIKLPAGIFIPTLCVGACFGRIVGLLVQYVQWTRPELAVFQWCTADKTSACIVPGVYAMVGAAATLSGVTRTTISLVVIMFELTGTLTYSVPVMLSVLVARTVADALEPKGIYDLVLEFSGMPYLDAKEEHTWQGVSIVDAVDAAVDRISLDDRNTVQSLRCKLERLALLAGNPDGGFPIVVRGGRVGDASSTQRLVGYIAAQELEHGLNRLVAAESSAGKPADLSRMTCSFNFLPRPHVSATASPRTSQVVPELDRDNDDTDNLSESAAGDEVAERMMRDSTLLASFDAPHDLSIFVDRAPITLTTSSPLELVQQLFVKLGVRYIVVLHASDGRLKGVIFKKRWLAFLHSLDEGKKHV